MMNLTQMTLCDVGLDLYDRCSNVMLMKFMTQMTLCPCDDNDDDLYETTDDRCSYVMLNFKTQMTDVLIYVMLMMLRFMTQMKIVKIKVLMEVKTMGDKNRTLISKQCCGMRVNLHY